MCLLLVKARGLAIQWKPGSSTKKMETVTKRICKVRQERLYSALIQMEENQQLTSSSISLHTPPVSVPTFSKHCSSLVPPCRTLSPCRSLRGQHHLINQSSAELSRPMGHLIIPPSYSSFHCPFLFPFFVTLIMNQNNFLLIGLFTNCLLESRGTLPISVAPWTVPGTRQSFSKFFPSPLCPQCARHSLSLHNGDESGVGSMRANSMPILDFWDLKANKT